MGLPVWRYRVAGFTFEKRVHLIARAKHRADPLSPAVGRGTPAASPAARSALSRPRRHGRRPAARRLSGGGVGQTIRGVGRGAAGLADALRRGGAALVLDGGQMGEVYYRVEAQRGYDARGQLWSPGYFAPTWRPATKRCCSARPRAGDCRRGAAAPGLQQRARSALPVAGRGTSAGAQRRGGRAGPGGRPVSHRPEARTEDAARAEAAGDECGP